MASMMERHLFIFLFFTGIVPCVLYETRKYYLVQQSKSWTDAQLYCQASHTDLAIVKSNDDMIQLQNEAQIQNFGSGAWIGMYSDINSWRWSTNYEPVGSMRPWQAGEPNNNGVKQNCGAVTPVGWSDRKCTELRSFICFDGTKTGDERYIYISNTKAWVEAQAYCRLHHTDLAIARDAKENSLLLGKISGFTWFGMIKDPWKWVDHTNFSTISWVSGQPNNNLGKENCGYLDMGQAADAPCTSLNPFFCYSPFAKQQAVRMKIRSDQDLNDPAVNAALLEKIKEKLKERGMEKDIVVKWRVKPDGVIFEKAKETENEVVNEDMKLVCVSEEGAQDKARWRQKIRCGDP